MADLSRLKVIPVREVWKHEAHDFTQWMLDNADVLADVLSMDLELEAAEHPVGGFSLDLIGREVVTGHVVIVENQLERSDHTHLGQILTYAGGTNPQTIVWCAPAFTDPHRAAIDWLNEHTDEDTRFFAVEVAAVQIDDSRPAPMFRLVAQPNDWAKQVHTETSAGPSKRGVAYMAFWTDLLVRIHEIHPEWTRSTAGSKDSWITLPYGSSNTWYGFVFGQLGPRVELYFGSVDADANLAAFNAVAKYAEQITADAGIQVAFDAMPEKKACRIHITREGRWADVLDTPTHDDVMDWFITTMESFRPATQRVKALIEASEAHG